MANMGLKAPLKFGVEFPHNLWFTSFLSELSCSLASDDESQVLVQDRKKKQT